METSPNCPSCATPVARDSRFCASCGTPVDPASLTPTELHDPTAGTAASAPAPAVDAGPGAGHGAGFAPGHVLAGRYRIAGLLGRGGMGEVYRADDLKLGQPVALKFLSARLAGDAKIRERFYDEVRAARQVTHPNVCRVHDIGELDGRPYLSMEYIDGEDLASLLRRIGHLPKVKAVEIARQLCAGLAAAHDRGLLHRDLKPANVMLDGRGHVRVTDFGLAGLAERLRNADVRSGTPAYMAPEQLAGREVTHKSDLYALGLLLYEVFTGKPAFEAGSVAELRSLQQETTPTSLTTHVDDADPAVEGVIRRCLDPDPERRPESARAVAAALPGGDPLAAALAAGETPSPEMVAAAGKEGSLRPAAALGLLAVFLAAGVAVLWLGRGRKLLPLLAPELPRQVLVERAREVLRIADHEPATGDTAHGFYFDRDALRHLRETGSEGRDEARRALDAARSGTPPVIVFWYRTGRQDLFATRGQIPRVTSRDPPLTDSGTAVVALDTLGKLVELRIVPPQREDEPAGAADVARETDWDALLEQAGFDPARMEPAEPLWSPPLFGDARRAWTLSAATGPAAPPADADAGADADAQGRAPLAAGTRRVEVASYRGRPVYFRAIGPWSRPERMVPSPRVAETRVQQAVVVAVILAVLGLALVAARRNLRDGRADRRGAFRLGLAVFLGYVVVWALWSHHASRLPLLWFQFMRSAGFALYLAALTWMMYVALEPYVRRRFPRRIISWNRLLAGHLADPLVGRDVLIGAVSGATMAFVAALGPVARGLGGGRDYAVDASWVDPLYGVGSSVGRLLFVVPDNVFGAMLVLFLWVLLHRALRVGLLADVLLIGLVAWNSLGAEGFSWLALAIVLVIGVGIILLLRYALLSLIVAFVVLTVLDSISVPHQLAAWYAPGIWTVVGAIAALAAVSFHVSLGGRNPFAGSPLGD